MCLLGASVPLPPRRPYSCYLRCQNFPSPLPGLCRFLLQVHPSEERRESQWGAVVCQGWTKPEHCVGVFRAIHSIGQGARSKTSGLGLETGPGAGYVYVIIFWHESRRSQRILHLNSAFSVVIKTYLSTEVDGTDFTYSLTHHLRNVQT